MLPKISVIIPVYNGHRFIARAINSALSQTMPPHEIIVVDDGSTDSTPAILANYGNRVRYRRIPHSGGASVPRNLGMSIAQGDYIAFLDSDDIWHRQKLELQLEAFESFPSVSLICSDYYARYDGRLGRHFSHRRYRKELSCGQLVLDSPFDAFQILISRNFVGCPSAVMIRRELTEAAGIFDPRLTLAEDYEYWVRCSLHTFFLIVSRPLAFKRTHDENVSLNQPRLLSARKQILFSLILKHYPRLARENLTGDWRRSFADLNLTLARTHEPCHWHKKLLLYLEALMIDPSPKTVNTILAALGKLNRPAVPSPSGGGELPQTPAHLAP